MNYLKVNDDPSPPKSPNNSPQLRGGPQYSCLNMNLPNGKSVPQQKDSKVSV